MKLLLANKNAAFAYAIKLNEIMQFQNMLKIMYRSFAEKNMVSCLSRTTCEIAVYHDKIRY